MGSVPTRSAPPTQPILAAGAVVLRTDDTGGNEVLVIHRDGYDDWTLPKGHLEPGEQLPVAAVREVGEETGTMIRLGASLPVSRYPVEGRPKEVHWWVGFPTGETTEPTDDEADVVTWLPVDEARQRLTFETDRDLVSRALELSSLIPFLVVRHCKALSRSDWKHEDSRRPLTKRGRAQAEQLIPLLAAYGVVDVASSAAVRCADSLVPYARKHRLRIDRYESLTEEAATEHPIAATETLRDLATAAVQSGRPAAVCGHRPVLPMMLEAIGVDARPFSIGDCVVAYLDPQGHAVLSDHVEMP